jgi:hypothetical protein
VGIYPAPSFFDVDKDSGQIRIIRDLKEDQSATGVYVVNIPSPIILSATGVYVVNMPSLITLSGTGVYVVYMPSLIILVCY